MTFRGWPETALDFYEDLEADNSKAYWTAHKATYESDVRAPMLALLADLAGEFGEGKIFRPYRDTRFASDKSPYKTSCSAFTGEMGGVGRYVSLSAAGLVAAGGLHGPEPQRLARLRAAIDDERSGAELVRIVAPLERAGYVIGGEELKTAPRGFDRDHPRVRWLRHRHLYAWQEWKPEPWLHTAKARSKVVEVWRRITPLCDWLTEYTG